MGYIILLCACVSSFRVNFPRHRAAENESTRKKSKRHFSSSIHFIFFFHYASVSYCSSAIAFWLMTLLRSRHMYSTGELLNFSSLCIFSCCTFMLSSINFDSVVNKSVSNVHRLRLMLLAIAYLHSRFTITYDVGKCDFGYNIVCVFYGKYAYVCVCVCNEEISNSIRCI